jgi:hypothetical protein
LFSAAIAVVGVSGFTFINSNKSQNGSKVAYTNSPHDGAGDCTGCHGGGSTTPVITLTATPAFGTGNTYIPGTVYTLAYKVTGYPKFGFDIELNAGNATTAMGAGTNVAVTNCKVTANPYNQGYPANVSHTAPIVSSSAATWNWTAPSSGIVYIYSVGVGVNGNGSESGDKMGQYNLVLTPAGSTGIVDYKENNTLFDLNLYPNPTKDNIHLTYNLDQPSKVSIKIYNIGGQLVASLLDKTQEMGAQSLDANLSLSKGIYTVSLNVEGKQTIKKLIVQ